MASVVKVDDDGAFILGEVDFDGFGDGNACSQSFILSFKVSNNFLKSSSNLHFQVGKVLKSDQILLHSSRFFFFRRFETLSSRRPLDQYYVINNI